MVSISEIFADFGNDGLRESFREFLGYFVKQFFPLVNTQIEKLYYARLDYPLIVFPMYLLAILGLFLFWKKPRTSTAIWAAIPAGLLFYFYFHYWVYWVVVLGLLFIYSFFTKNKNSQLFKSFLILIGIIAVIAAPYFINYLNFSKFPDINDVTFRLGVATGRAPGLSTIGLAYLAYIVIAVGIYFLYFKKGERKTAVLFWSFLIAMIIIWNIQLVVGYVPTPNNWRRTISPILYIVIFHFVYTLVRNTEIKFPPIKKIAAITLILLTAGVVAKKVANVYVIYQNPEPRILTGQTLDKDFMDAFAWIDANLSPESKIISNSFMTSIYLNVYTSARPFLPLWMLSPQSTKELENRFLISHRLFATSPQTLAKIVSSDLPIECVGVCPSNTEENLRKNTWHLYGHYFRSRGDINSYLNHPLAITDEYIMTLVEKYKKTKVNFSSVDADYLFFGPWEKQFSEIDFDQNKDLELVYQNPNVKLFRIKR